MANKRTKPDAAGGLQGGTHLDEDAGFRDGPVQVALVTRAAGVDLSSIPRFPQPHPSIEIDLPPLPKSEVPEDEAAVAIDDVAVDPGSLAAATSSVEIMPGDTGDVPDVRSLTTGSLGSLVTGPTPRSSLTTGSLSRTTGSMSRPTGSMPAPRRTGSAYDALLGAPVSPPGPLGGHLPGSTGEFPRLDGAGTATRRERRTGTAPVAGEPESAAMLTPDRLIENGGRVREKPTGAWNRFVYAATLHRLNLGDSADVRIAKDEIARITKPFEGGTRFVPVLTRKGGVGKTTVTTLLGMTMATLREDRVIAIDANPDRGTLSERVTKQTRATVRDVVTRANAIGGFTDFSTLVSRDETRLDILASDTDPLLSEAFDENDYNVVADLAARFYSIALTDCGTGIVHSVMRATLQRADSIVIVSGGSVDESRLASETLTWLEANGYGDLVRNAVVAINTATHGTSLVKLDEIEAHFASRVRDIVRIPYDPQLAAGSVVDYKNLKQTTKDAARTLAALVADGLPSRRDG
ncbi:MinD/ParA family ATP-binding protein [Amnibacterium kyonggiense]|uniref:MinD-like ATPase involved in chromosome partitioning or flagellar assembly n=1 Tax=Amnibacterium kyonggiense TaxID=595671 RepID=A0A4V6Q0Z0_9MICO|nr:MinD/ParA family protein [Amnibacterium kyonggiense]TDS77004.1 MinD-like ATPase involved in chromosome partitioning or flagellar assembly [Amnibacterium kyonggiense]